MLYVLDYDKINDIFVIVDSDDNQSEEIFGNKLDSLISSLEYPVVGYNKNRKLVKSYSSYISACNYIANKVMHNFITDKISVCTPHDSISYPMSMPITICKDIIVNLVVTNSYLSLNLGLPKIPSIKLVSVINNNKCMLLNNNTVYISISISDILSSSNKYVSLINFVKRILMEYK